MEWFKTTIGNFIVILTNWQAFLQGKIQGKNGNQVIDLFNSNFNPYGINFVRQLIIS